MTEASPQGPVRLAKMALHPRRETDNRDSVTIEAELSPTPPVREHWWWGEQVREKVGWPSVGMITSTDRFALRITTSRGSLEAVACQLRDAVTAAIAAYPTRYLIDQQALDEWRADRDLVRRQQEEADQAVLDRVMGVTGSHNSVQSE